MVELILGCFFLASALITGFVLIHRPWTNWIDGIGLRLLPADPSSKWAGDLAHLGSIPILLESVVALCAIAVLTRHRERALVCLIAPVGSVLAVGLVATPGVSSAFVSTSARSYPSETATSVAALAVAGFILSPRFAKRAVALTGGVIVAAVCAAGVVLRWHYLTDDLGGVSVGVGAVLTVDGTLTLALRRYRERSVQRGLPTENRSKPVTLPGWRRLDLVGRSEPNRSLLSSTVSRRAERPGV